MSTPEITPDLLRAVADWIERVYSADGTTEALRLFAGDLDREQADEQRIDECVKVFFRAAEVNPTEYNVRLGIRAVRAKLEEERAQESCDTLAEAVKGAPVHPRTWDDLRDVPADVQRVTDKDGAQLRRAPGTIYGWKWWLGGPVTIFSSLTSYAPYTEIDGGAA